MQKPWDWMENQNQVLHPKQNQGENRIDKSRRLFFNTDTDLILSNI